MTGHRHATAATAAVATAALAAAAVAAAGLALPGCSTGPTDPAESIVVPLAPSGETELAPGVPATFTVLLAVTSTGHALEYQFDWGDGARSEWGPQTATDYAWSTAGAYPVRARARCALHTAESSAWSASLSVSVIGADPVCVVEPASLAFGTVPVGEAVDREFTIRNDGGGTLTGAIAESCGEYSIVSGLGSYGLAAGESLAVTVRFAPVSSGKKTCTVETGCTAALDCTGDGEDPPPGPVCIVNPTRLVFGMVPVGQSVDRTFTITNAGGGTLTGTVAESCADYSIVSGGGPYLLSAGEVRTVTVRVSPRSTGAVTCDIRTGCESVACVTLGGAPGR